MSRTKLFTSVGQGRQLYQWQASLPIHGYYCSWHVAAQLGKGPNTTIDPWQGCRFICGPISSGFQVHQQATSSLLGSARLTIPNQSSGLSHHTIIPCHACLKKKAICHCTLSFFMWLPTYLAHEKPINPKHPQIMPPVRNNHQSQMFTTPVKWPFAPYNHTTSCLSAQRKPSVTSPFFFYVDSYLFYS